jgi:hypothetical protein
MYIVADISSIRIQFAQSFIKAIAVLRNQTITLSFKIVSTCILQPSLTFLIATT